MAHESHLTKKDVESIASYARIALTDDELAEMTSYLNDALGLLEPIRAYDLAGVEPTFHPIGDLSNVMAQDVVDADQRALPHEAALANAASRVGRSFRVPSILGETEAGS